MAGETPRYGALGALLLAATMLLGCERLGKARQCQALAETVNEGMARIDAEGPDALSEKHLREAAAAYESLASELGPMEFSEKQLALEVASLNRTLLQASTTTRNLADALAGDERAQASLIKRELSSLGSQMKLQGSKIDRACRAH